MSLLVLYPLLPQNKNFVVTTLCQAQERKILGGKNHEKTMFLDFDGALHGADASGAGGGGRGHRGHTSSRNTCHAGDEGAGTP